IAVIAFAFTFPLNRMVGRSFIPNEDMGELTVHIDTPEGTSAQGMAEVAKNVAKELRPIEGIAHITIQSGPSNNVNHAHLQVQLLPVDQRKVTQDQAIARIRKVLSAHPGMRPAITTRTALGGGEQNSYPIQANLLGPDMNKLAEYSLRLLGRAQQEPSL